MTRHELCQRIDYILSQLPLAWRWVVNPLNGVGFSEKDVWSRTARRQINKGLGGFPDQGNGQMTTSETVQNNKCMRFGFEIRIENIPECNPCKNQMVIRWIKGCDAVVFESFCGMMKRKCLEQNNSKIEFA